jgi:hypothetical protein
VRKKEKETAYARSITFLNFFYKLLCWNLEHAQQTSQISLYIFFLATYSTRSTKLAKSHFSDPINLTLQKHGFLGLQLKMGQAGQVSLLDVYLLEILQGRGLGMVGRDSSCPWAQRVLLILAICAPCFTVMQHVKQGQNCHNVRFHYEPEAFFF